MNDRGPRQAKDSVLHVDKFSVLDKTSSRPSHLYNGNPYNGKDGLHYLHGHQDTRNRGVVSREAGTALHTYSVLYAFPILCNRNVNIV